MNSKIIKYQFWLFYLMIFTLPMYTKINNILLVIFIIFGFLDIITTRKKVNLKVFLLNGWPVLVFFCLAAFAAFRNFDFQVFKYLENHWSLIFVPFIILTNRKEFLSRQNHVFLSLLWGTVLTLLICNINHVVQMFKAGLPMMEWYGKGFNSHNFTEIADTHPAYLSLFVITSILFLIQNDKLHNNSKTIISIVLFLGLFQLTSKLGFLLSFSFLFYVVVHRFKKQSQKSTILVFGLIISFAVFLTLGGKYMKGSMFFVNNVLDEKRIERWEVSYEIFQENPLTGVGYREIDEIRRNKYHEKKYSLAAANELNAHNQFLEYLSINGFFGGFFYAISLGFLFLLSVQKKDYLFAFIFFVFVLANLTESMMVRIKGIEYFTVFASLFLCRVGKENDGHSIQKGIVKNMDNK